jgi:hypothetical protein
MPHRARTAYSGQGGVGTRRPPRGGSHLDPTEELSGRPNVHHSLWRKEAAAALASRRPFRTRDGDDPIVVSADARSRCAGGDHARLRLGAAPACGRFRRGPAQSYDALRDANVATGRGRNHHHANPSAEFPRVRAGGEKALFDEGAPTHWGYLESGVDGDVTRDANHTAYAKYKIRVQR